VDGQIRVFDVWDSMEHFQAFGATLGPVMSKPGVDPDHRRSWQFEASINVTDYSATS